jgi:hypothetical protein
VSKVMMKRRYTQSVWGAGVKKGEDDSDSEL